MTTADRPRVDDALLGLVARRLTDRDRAICRSLDEHRVLTTMQVRDLHFDGVERTRKRLAQLHELRVLERFRPYRQLGSSPYHYVLDRLGAEIVASERGLSASDLGWSRTSVLHLATSAQLRHLTETNDFLTRLIRALRRRADAELIEWRTQRRCAAAWGDVVRPDAYLRLRIDGRGTEAWLEWDRSTEQHSRLADKVDRYEELAAILERRVTLLLVVAGDARERQIRQRLRRSADVTVFTTTAARHRHDALGRNWLALGTEDRRRSLGYCDRGTPLG